MTSEKRAQKFHIDDVSLPRNHSLRSKCFRLVSAQRKTEEAEFSVLAAQKMDRDPRSFNRAIFGAVFDTRSSFFASKPHGNACYSSYRSHSSRGFHKKSVN